MYLRLQPLQGEDLSSSADFESLEAACVEAPTELAIPQYLLLAWCCPGYRPLVTGDAEKLDLTAIEQTLLIKSLGGLHEPEVHFSQVVEAAEVVKLAQALLSLDLGAIAEGDLAALLDHYEERENASVPLAERAAEELEQVQFAYESAASNNQAMWLYTVD